MNFMLTHTQNCLIGWIGKNDRQLGCFFGLSFLLHLCSVMLFVLYADRAMRNDHQDVFYIDLNQISLPFESQSEGKSSAIAARKPEKAPIPVQPVKKDQPSQSVMAPSRQMQQTVISESAKSVTITNSEPVSMALQGNPGPSTSSVANPQAKGSVSAATTVGTSESTGLDGEIAFGSASGPSFLQRILPTFPMVARRFNREGKVILRLTIDAVGSLVAVEILQDPGYAFAAAAVEAVRRLRFLPARHEGRPVTAKAILPIRFILQGAN